MWDNAGSSQTSGQTPTWLRKLERPLGWIAIPNIALLLVTLQALGYLLVLSNPIWFERLVLIPELVPSEPWRLITFLAVPVSLGNPIFAIIALWFTYFIVNAVESVWGEFRTTFYVLVSILVTIAFSFAFDYPITQARHFESTLFLAAAALFPEMEMRLYFAIPVKMKWMGWLTLALVAWEFLGMGWLGRLYLLAIYSNYLLFFGPALVASVRQGIRRRRFRRQYRG